LLKQSLEKHKDKLELFYLPPYSPDMNPQELVNQDVKANSNNFRALKSLKDLTINLRYYLTKIQFDEFKIRNFFTKKEL
jgi:transposase